MTRIWLAPVFVLCAGVAIGQNAELSGLVQDPSNSGVPGAEVSIRNEQTGGRRNTRSNGSGFYSLPALSPGDYRLSIRAMGFETVVREGIKLEVGENARMDFSLRLGDFRTEVTVHGGPALINSENASVGTVIDRDIIDKMPLNGRGIQSLIALSPGVVVVPVVDPAQGQFAVNGQRSNSNYLTVDGVSANFALGQSFSSSVSGVAIFGGFQAGSGMIPANSFLGTFSNLVSPEALQEFKIQTSTFAPEFGRSPGARIGLVTRSGTNRYSGSLFEYFRNDKTDANDWFVNQQSLPKAPLRFNNFGGVVGGPVRVPHLYNGRDRTFFFFSFEDVVMLQPQPVVSFSVPTLEARLNAPPLVAALLNAYPLPNRPAPDSATTGVSTYTGSSSLQNDQQTYGVRFDHIFNDRLIAFARYNRAPSTRHSQAVGLPYTLINPDYTLGTEMLTLGLTHVLTSNMVNESRFNESSQSATGEDGVNRASGAQSPPASLLFPAGDSFQDSSSTFGVSSAPMVKLGSEGQNRTSQIQALDNFSYSLGTHALKLGVDYRRFSSELFGLRFFSYFVLQSLNGSLGAYSGTIPDVLAGRIDSPATAYKTEAFSAYAQDTWRTRRGLAITYGLRWEVDPAPQTAGQAAIIIGLANPHDPTTGHYLRPGEPPYATSWSKFAPRLGIAWQIHDGEARKTVLRLGAGRFFDLGQAGFEGSGFLSHTLFNYTDQPLGSITGGTVFAGAPTTVETAVPALVVARGYTLPYTWQWNLTIEQSIGQQTLSAGYIGALGRRLVGWSAPPQPVNGRYFYTYTLNNDASSNYHSMQLQFNRRLSTRLHILVSYTWSHSIDNLSGDFPDTIFAANPLSRGSSNFDVRHSLNGSIIASLPSPRGGIRATFLRNWTANSIFFARSALPTDLFGDQSGNRPNVVPRQPLYLYGSNYPGGRSFNSAAFSVPPAGFDGDLGRNALRGLCAWQIDFALHREFRLADDLSLQFRAEAFNILNHPNFANPSDLGKVGVLTLPLYPGSGSSTQMLNTGLGPNNVLGQLSSLFQVGGPRTMQFALRIRF